MATRNTRPHLKRALTSLRRSTGVSVAFGGHVAANGNLVLDHFDGHTVGALNDLQVSMGEGLGGQVVALQRTTAVNDYFDTQAITHRYDQLIRAEGFRAVVASPVVVHRRAIAVIYGAYRDDEIVGGRVQDAITQEARALEQQAVLSAALAQTSTDRSSLELETVGLREHLHTADAQLRRLAAITDHPEVRAALATIIDGPSSTPDEKDAGIPVTLTPREADVLSLAGSGLSNARIGESLGLTLHTVKSYMKSAMSKLNAGSRLEAVVEARRARLIA